MTAEVENNLAYMFLKHILQNRFERGFINAIWTTDIFFIVCKARVAFFFKFFLAIAFRGRADY